jgi:hypothetical protein
LRENIARIDNTHNIFLDKYGLTVGSNIKEALLRRIQWCDYFIVILSKRSVKSKWVRYEIQQVRKSEEVTGEKKLFALHLDDSDLPKILADYLVLECTNPDYFTSDFFTLMNSIYMKPTHYSVEHEVKNDPAYGYLFDLWVECAPEFKKRIECVEYRFDYEFDHEGWNSKRIGGAVHVVRRTENNQKKKRSTMKKSDQKKIVDSKSKELQKKFGVGDLWTSESITIFIGIYLKNTKVIYFRKYIEIGSPLN